MASGDYSVVVHSSLLLLLCCKDGLQSTGSLVVVYGLSCPLVVGSSAPGIEPVSPALQGDLLLLKSQGKPRLILMVVAGPKNESTGKASGGSSSELAWHNFCLILLIKNKLRGQSRFKEGETDPIS